MLTLAATLCLAATVPIDERTLLELAAQKPGPETNRAWSEAWKSLEALGALPARNEKLRGILDEWGYPLDGDPTLRDALCILWSKSLADRRGWTAAQLRGLRELNLDLLIAANAFKADPVDAQAHPLARAVQVLGELGIRPTGRQSSALVMVRWVAELRILHFAYQDPAARAKIRSALEKYAPRYAAAFPKLRASAR